MFNDPKQTHLNYPDFRNFIQILLGFLESGSWLYDTQSGDLELDSKAKGFTGSDTQVNLSQYKGKNPVLLAIRELIASLEGISISSVVIKSATGQESIKIECFRLTDESMIFGLCGEASENPDRDFTIISQYIRKVEKEYTEADENADIFENIHDVYYRANAEGELTMVTPNALSTLGYSDLSELTGKNIALHFYKDPRDREHLLSELIKHGSVKQYPVRLKKKDGTVLFAETCSALTYDKQGNITGIEGIIRDVTATMRAMEELKRKEEQYRAIFENNSVGIYVSDTNGRITEVNSKGCELFGYGYEEMKNLDVRKLTPQSNNSNIEIFLNLDDNETCQYESSHIRKDGSLFYCEVVGSRFNYLGTPHFLAIIQDISKRKVSEEHSRHTENMYRQLFEKSPLGIAIYDEDLTIIDVNKEFARFIGTSKVKLTGFQIRKALDKSIIPAIEAPFSGNDGYYQGKYYTSTSSRMVYATMNTFYGKMYHNGELIKVGIAIVDDITENIIFERALKESEELYRSVAQSAIAGIGITDTEENLVFVNPAFATMLGYTQEELLNRNLQDFSPTGEYEKFRTETNQRQKGHKSIYEAMLIRKDSTLLNILVSASPMFNENGLYKGTVGVVIDITERIQAQEKLVEERRKAEEANQMKSHFLANMSHEIRTPMNAILGFADLLADSALKDDQKTFFVDQISRSGEHLMHLINDIIDISKIEARQLVISKTSFTASSIISDIQAVYNEKIRTRNPNLKINFLQENQKLVVFSDYNRIRQILTNLIDNAIKFTSQGIIEISVLADDKNIRWTVKDTGRGIPIELQDLIFDRYKQTGEQSQTKNPLGNGLGLTIAKSLAELLGGSLSLISKPGKGSAFTLTIPFVAPQTVTIPISAIATDTEYNWSGKTILIAEDEENNFVFLKTALRNSGAKLIRAINGKEVIGKMKSFPEINLVLMDLKMPIMSGYDAQKVLQKEFPGIPVVAQTAYAMQGEREKCLEAGFADYLSKPIKKSDLLNCLSILLK